MVHTLVTSHKGLSKCTGLVKRHLHYNMNRTEREDHQELPREALNNVI